jgi:hypothetical protein
MTFTVVAWALPLGLMVEHPDTGFVRGHDLLRRPQGGVQALVQERAMPANINF